MSVSRSSLAIAAHVGPRGRCKCVLRIGIGLTFLWAFLDKSAVSLEQVDVPKEIAIIMQGAIVLSVVVAYEVVKRADLAAAQRRVGRALSGGPAGISERGAV